MNIPKFQKHIYSGMDRYKFGDYRLDCINQRGRYLEMNELYQTLVLSEWIVPNFESVRIDE